MSEIFGNFNQFEGQNYTQSNKNIPFYMRLYPPLEPQNEYSSLIFNNLLQLKNSSNNYNRAELKNLLEKTETEEDELTQDFLDDLVNPSCIIPKSKIVEVVSKAIVKSKLIEKIEDDSKIAKKINSAELSIACAKKFPYILVKKGETVFKIGETGDKFFYILKGKVNILKIREIPNLYMSIMEYINYCLFLIKSEENFLFQEVIQRNYNVLQVSNPEEVLTLYKITFKKLLHENINQHLIYSNQLLEEYFKAFNQKYSDYNIDKRQLDLLDINKKKKLPGSYRDWQNYILKKSELSTNELVTYEPFEQIIKDRKKKKIVCFIYESFLFLGPGLYFGDFALDSEFNKRNATIRAEEDTYLGWLRSTDYLNIIAPKRRYEKMKEIAFLFNSFFFNNINPHTFERNYFHLFYLREYQRGTILFNPGIVPKNIFLVKEGQISLDLKCSVIGLHKLIKFLYNKILTNSLFSKFSSTKKRMILSQETNIEIHKYLKEPKLERLKMQNSEFIKEMNKIRIFHITLLIGVEAVGLEEIFLKIPYLMKATAIKNIICYEFAVEQINNLLRDEKEIRFSYALNSIKKILSLIERLQAIKKNCVEMSNAKYNIKNETIFEKMFTSTQKFPKIHKKTYSHDITNKKENTLDHHNNKLIIKDDINFHENIYTILNKTNPNNSKSRSKENNESKEIMIVDKNNNVSEIKNSIDEMKREKETEKDNEIDKDKDNDKGKTMQKFKKIKIINSKDKSRNIFTKYKSPIRDFIINNDSYFKLKLFSNYKVNKIKNAKFIAFNKKKHKNNSYFGKELSNVPQDLELNEGKVEDNQTKNNNKNRANIGIKLNNLFLLGDKYYTINKLKKQIKNFNSLENNKKTLEVIQSNRVYNYGDNNTIVPSDIKNSKIKKIGKLSTFDIRKLKRNFVKFSQEFKNFHLSFVPISAESCSNNNTINDDNSNYYSRFFRNNSYSTLNDKFFSNKTTKNYFLITKKNKQNKKKHLNKANSNISDYHKELPQIQNDYLNFNLRNKKKNNFSSQMYFYNSIQIHSTKGDNNI